MTGGWLVDTMQLRACVKTRSGRGNALALCAGALDALSGVASSGRVSADRMCRKCSWRCLSPVLGGDVLGQFARSGEAEAVVAVGLSGNRLLPRYA